MDEYVSSYTRLVRCFIIRISRGRVRPDDIADYVQAVHLRVLQTGYLERVRALIAERGGGLFPTYLFLLVRSVLVNDFKRNGRNPLNTAYRIGVQDEPPQDRTMYPEQIPSRCDYGFEDRENFELAIQRFADYIETTRRGALTAKALELVPEGWTSKEISAAEGIPLKRVVQARRDLRSSYRAFMRRVG